MPLDGPVYVMDWAKVNGKFPPQIWEYAKRCFPGDIRWNFEGIFLFDASGVCMGRWTRNELDDVSAAIEVAMSGVDHAALATTTTRAPTTTTKKPEIAGPKEKGLQDLVSAYTIDGRKMPMSELAGTPVLMINVASKCGMAKKIYTQIHDWHKKHPDTLKILLYPSSEFGRAELPTDEIKPFLSTFPPTEGMPLDGPVYVMDKAKVNGRFPPPIWEYAKACFPGDIRWNFEGIFLFDKSGACVGRWTRDELDSVGAAIETVM